VAVDLARHLGAARIGLIGVDFDDDHFFAATGRHPLIGQLGRIDLEYGRLADACRADGVELVNLSPTSRLTSLPRASLDSWPSDARARARRVTFVHYRFLSCGTVFETGLREAAQALAISAEHAYWDDEQLPQKIERFQPELVFVVHGRRFVQRWGKRLCGWRSAVWLLDEPYEVDDTSTWSGQFDFVFVNDTVTRSRHRHAHELPVAYSPSLHRAIPGGTPRYRVGFVGGANPTRERSLAALAKRGLLDYVVGGPWRDPALASRCVAANVPAERTAALYQDTAIVINVFRDRHHFNRAGVQGRAMNPRIYEALACGALVISEPRDELIERVPDLPTFRTDDELAALVERFLARSDDRRRVQQACAKSLADATYAQRLRTVMEISSSTAQSSPRPRAAPCIDTAPISGNTRQSAELDGDWEDVGGVSRRAADGVIVINPGLLRGPGCERGLASRSRFESVELGFEVHMEPGACLLAKVNQIDRIDQTSNSYHLYADERRAYLARHNQVLRNLEPPGKGWSQFRLQAGNGVLTLWRDGRIVCRLRDDVLVGGYAFIGAQGGSIRVRSLALAASGARDTSAECSDEVDEHVSVTVPAPRLSIVTTVYDRPECLRRCIASVRRLAFRDFEHLIVADHPAPALFEQIRSIVADTADARLALFDLKRRSNNWGIAPAAAGLRRARGEFIAFLSDDNGYTPDHFGPLVRALDRDGAIGFVYSSCRYDGRLVLNHPVPRPGRIDLGQPLFRRELFQRLLGNDLPFDMMAWDWHLVDALMRRGVRWRHIDQQSFIFRLAKYPDVAA
jgi:spore maturation protein CgeB